MMSHISSVCLPTSCMYLYIYIYANESALPLRFWNNYLSKRCSEKQQKAGDQLLLNANKTASSNCNKYTKLQGVKNNSDFLPFAKQQTVFSWNQTPKETVLAAYNLKFNHSMFCVFLPRVVCLSTYRSASLCCCVSTCFATVEQEEPVHCVGHCGREKGEERTYYWRDATERDRAELQYEYTIGEFLRRLIEKYTLTFSMVTFPAVCKRTVELHFLKLFNMF